MANELSAAIIQVGFQNPDLLDRNGIRGLTYQQAKHICLALQVPLSRTQADRIDHHGRQVAELVDDRCNDGSPGRCCEFCLHFTVGEGNSLEQFCRGGCRNTHSTMSNLDRPATGRDR